MEDTRKLEIYEVKFISERSRKAGTNFETTLYVVLENDADIREHVEEYYDIGNNTEIKATVIDISTDLAARGGAYRELSWYGWCHWFHLHKPNARKDVLSYIARTIYRTMDKPNCEVHDYFDINDYIFAVILKDRFGGTICVNTKTKHVVWQDENGIYYDIDGVYEVHTANNEKVIPFSELNPDKQAKCKRL